MRPNLFPVFFFYFWFFTFAFYLLLFCFFCLLFAFCHLLFVFCFLLFAFYFLLFAFCFLLCAFCILASWLLGFFGFAMFSFNKQPNHWYEERLPFPFSKSHPFKVHICKIGASPIPTFIYLSPTITSSATTTTTFWSTKSLSLIHLRQILMTAKSGPTQSQMCSHVCARINARSATHKCQYVSKVDAQDLLEIVNGCHNNNSPWSWSFHIVSHVHTITKSRWIRCNMYISYVVMLLSFLCACTNVLGMFKLILLARVTIDCVELSSFVYVCECTLLIECLISHPPHRSWIGIYVPSVVMTYVTSLVLSSLTNPTLIMILDLCCFSIEVRNRI